MRHILGACKVSTGVLPFLVVNSRALCITTHAYIIELFKRIKADGRYLVHTVESHHQFNHPRMPGKVTAPQPKKDLLITTVCNILKRAALK
ncbi:type II toxin-antitoxin system HicA family toxin [Burkholderia lata]|uniref:type II toxin-antitoxin system HicA family toxin n=1 Tax=Burkholderia lata (strain ATCC 17760 / DSM 23089 / LMG 22485 / NCIMB 9086 / R18194 / 383) TaxID=482957 RepID=UPI003F689794